MTVTKQQQLEWMSKAHKEWPFILDDICMSSESVGDVSYAVGSHRIAKQEWQQELDRMQKQQDNSWHDRGELPPAGCKCEVNHENGSGWIRANVLSITSEYAILLNEGSAGEYPAKLSKTKFRPIDYEKTLFVSGVVEMVSVGLISTESAREFAMKLFDSGYRKVKL